MTKELVQYISKVMYTMREQGVTSDNESIFTYTFAQPSTIRR